MDLLRVDKVSKNFGGLVANQEVSFSVGKGEIIGLIGPNGAGKTTLFNCIAGFYPPASGEIWLEEKNVTGMKPEQCAHAGIARTFQIARTFTSMTAQENVMVGAFTASRHVGQARRRALEYLDFVHLGHLRDKPAGSMTVSEQRRLAIARALALEPKLLLMDEAMAGLNRSELKEAVEVVLRIRDRGISCLVVEHVLEAIMPIADRVIVLDYGRKIADGSPSQVSNNPQVIAAYIGE